MQLKQGFNLYLLSSRFFLKCGFYLLKYSTTYTLHECNIARFFIQNPVFLQWWVKRNLRTKLPMFAPAAPRSTENTVYLTSSPSSPSSGSPGVPMLRRSLNDQGIPCTMNLFISFTVIGQVLTLLSPDVFK